MHYQDCDFTRSQKIKQEFEDIFLHWVETNVLSFDRMAAETRHNSVLSMITSRIRKKNICGNCSRVKRPYKEIRHKLTIERGVICNGDLIIPLETHSHTQKMVLKSAYDDILCGVAATQKKDKIRSMVAGIFTRCLRIYKKMQKM